MKLHEGKSKLSKLNFTVIMLSLMMLGSAVLTSSTLVNSSSMPTVNFSSFGMINYSDYVINAGSPNFGWIQSDWWSYDAGMPYCLQNNLTYIVNQCANNGINIVNIFAGTYDGNTFRNWTSTPDSFWRVVIDAFHARGIQCYAWVEDANGETPNIAPEHYSEMRTIIQTVLAVGWDGYNDDIESIDLFNATSVSNWCNYANNMTLYCHSLGKSYSMCTNYDWTRQINQRLQVDYIQVMLYGAKSLLEDPQIDAYWFSEFATQSASPIAIGIMNYHGNTYSLGYQLNKLTYLLDAFPHNGLVGFGIWLVDDMNPSDWALWHYWINNLNPPNPMANVVSVVTNPEVLSTVVINGVNRTLPSTAYGFETQLLDVSVSPIAVDYNFAGVQFGDTYVGSGIGSGYSNYEYCSGANTITTQVTGNKCFFYSAAVGYVKLALYDSVVKNVAGFPDNRNYPNNLLAQSAPTLCHVGWNQIDLTQTVTLPAGTYFIDAKISASGMIVFANTSYWEGVWKASDYSESFSQSYGDFGGSMSSRLSVYFGSSAPTATTYYFNHWNDGITTASRQISASTTTYTAYYTTTPP
jgi:hypothetical protein